MGLFLWLCKGHSVALLGVQVWHVRMAVVHRCVAMPMGVRAVRHAVGMNLVMVPVVMGTGVRMDMGFTQVQRHATEHQPATEDRCASQYQRSLSP